MSATKENYDEVLGRWKPLPGVHYWADTAPLFSVLILGLGIVRPPFRYSPRSGNKPALRQSSRGKLSSYVAAIQKGIERNLEVVESISGLYTASHKVERDEFREF